MQYLTHDNLQLREGDEETIDRLSDNWRMPCNAADRGISEYRIGKHGFRESLAARAWIIKVNEFTEWCGIDLPIIEMAHTRITVCIRAITLLRGVDNKFAQEVVASAKAELDDYNRLIQNS